MNIQDAPVQQTLNNLKPGERHDILLNVPTGIKHVAINFTNVNPTLPPASQNALFGDDLLVFVHSAKTSAINDIGDYVAAAYTLGGKLTVDDPEPGILRVSVTGDWTNAGTISTDVSVKTTTAENPVAPKTKIQGQISDSQTVSIPVTILSNVSSAKFRLYWLDNWANYPTNDVDLILVDPNGTVDTDGATLNDPGTRHAYQPHSWNVDGNH